MTGFIALYATRYYTSQITIWHTMFSRYVAVFTRRYLVTDVNNDYSVLMAGGPFTPTSVFSLQADYQLNWQLNTHTHQPTTSRHFTQLNSVANQLHFITILHGPDRKQRLQQGVFTDPLLKTGCIIPFFYCCMRACCGRYLLAAVVYSHDLTTSLYATL
jgi:hypothetical protein